MDVTQQQDEYSKVLEEGSITYEDLKYRVRYRVHSHYISFDVWDINHDTFYQDGSICEPFEEEYIEYKGYVKWDGCSDWTFNTDKGMVHFCTRKQTIQLGELLGRLFDLGKKIPRWDDNNE